MFRLRLVSQALLVIVWRSLFGLAKRESDSEGASPTFLALHLDASSVLLHDLTRRRESNAHSRDAPADVGRAVELLEYARACGRRLDGRHRRAVTWSADASRQLENFTDFGHFPWVHPGLLGDPSRPVVPEHTVETDWNVLRYQVVRPEAPNSDDFPVFGNEETAAPMRRSRYELHLPYTIVLRLGWGGRRAWCTSSRRSRSTSRTARATS